LLFTDQSVFQLLPNAQVKEIQKFQPPLTALCRISTKYVLTVDPKLDLRVFAYYAEGECYKLVAQERLDSLMTISTTMTHDMLIVEKIQAIQKDLIVLVSGKSRNIVLAKLRDFDAPAPEGQDCDVIVNDELPKVCEYQNLAPFCLSKKPQMIVPIVPKERKEGEEQAAGD